MTVELKRQYYGTLWYEVYWSYLDLFLKSIAFAWVYAQPAVIYVTWRVGYYLYETSSDHWNMQRLLINSMLKRRLKEARERVAKRRLARLRGETYDEGSARYEGSNPLAEQRRKKSFRNNKAHDAKRRLEGDEVSEDGQKESDKERDENLDGGKVDITLVPTDSESSLYTSYSNESTDLDTSDDEGHSDSADRSQNQRGEDSKVTET